MAIDLIAELEVTLQDLEGKVIDKINSNVPPPNAPSTIKSKGSSHTLIDRGNMKGAITHRIYLQQNTVYGLVGIFEEELAEIGWRNETGNGPPERPFMRPAWDNNIERIMADLEERLGKKYDLIWQAP